MILGWHGMGSVGFARCSVGSGVRSVVSGILTLVGVRVTMHQRLDRRRGGGEMIDQVGGGAVPILE